MMSSASSDSTIDIDQENIIKLNVGGELFMTYRSTIMKSDATHLINLVKQTSTRHEIYIDRSSELFQDIMLYIRENAILVKDLKKLQALLKEAIFYNIKSMIDKVQAAIIEAEELQEKQDFKPKVVLKDIRQMYDTFQSSTITKPKYKIIEEKDGVSQDYYLIDIVYIKDINRCFDHGKAYCSCSSSPKLVLIPKNAI
ncbi:hypothetical protein [Parasitella parasitica]|uniref:BTB domain-containing protein n=1 Tax=Parasitella parasitica TaxID=35722 RepID=A0A0B7MWI7_9FUNG|nr:hypothetical protein [Parasitella parasitica]